MAQPTALAILTEQDRACDKCHSRTASADDWLCKECRDEFEVQWQRLTTDARDYLEKRATTSQMVTLNA